MAEIRNIKTHAEPLHEQINWKMFDRAYGAGMSLSAFLEKEDPSDEYNDGMDALERQIAVAGITTASDPDGAFYADKFERFTESEASTVIMAEWMTRQYKKVARQKQAERAEHEQLVRAILTSDQSAIGTIMRPYVNSAQVRMKAMQAAIPVSELIATSTPIDGNTYRSLYLQDSVSEYRMVRVGETAEIPLSVLAQSERAITIYKVGRGLGLSYETIRHTPIDLVGFWLARLAIQAEVDKASIIIDTIVNGDGNSGTAAEVITADSLDSAAGGGVLTLSAWEGFQLEWDNPYSMTTILLNSAELRKVRLLDTGNNYTRADQLTGYRSLVPINPDVDGPIRYGKTSDAPTGQIIGFDARFAIEQVTEIGATVNETKKWVEKQVDALYFTETEGYAVIDNDASKILDVLAAS